MISTLLVVIVVTKTAQNSHSLRKQTKIIEKGRIWRLICTHLIKFFTKLDKATRREGGWKCLSRTLLLT